MFTLTPQGWPNWSPTSACRTGDSFVGVPKKIQAFPGPGGAIPAFLSPTRGGSRSPAERGEGKIYKLELPTKRKPCQDVVRFFDRYFVPDRAPSGLAVAVVRQRYHGTLLAELTVGCYQTQCTTTLATRLSST